MIAQSSVTDCPAVTLDGVAVNDVMMGMPAATTATAAVAVLEPEGLVAVSMYIVFEEGLTVVSPERGRSPIP